MVCGVWQLTDVCRASYVALDEAISSFKSKVLSINILAITFGLIGCAWMVYYLYVFIR